MSKFITLFERQDWSFSVYASGNSNLNEAFPSDMHESREDGFTMRLYVYRNHTRDSVTRRSEKKIITNYIIHDLLEF